MFKQKSHVADCQTKNVHTKRFSSVRSFWVHKLVLNTNHWSLLHTLNIVYTQFLCHTTTTHFHSSRYKLSTAFASYICIYAISVYVMSRMVYKNRDSYTDELSEYNPNEWQFYLMCIRKKETTWYTEMHYRSRSHNCSFHTHSMSNASITLQKYSTTKENFTFLFWLKTLYILHSEITFFIQIFVIFSITFLNENNLKFLDW